MEPELPSASRRAPQGDRAFRHRVTFSKTGDARFLSHRNTMDVLERAIRAAGLPARMDRLAKGAMPADRLLEHMAQDKKAEGGKLNFILARGIGQAFVAKDVDANEVRSFLIEEGATPWHARSPPRPRCWAGTPR